MITIKLEGLKSLQDAIDRKISDLTEAVDREIGASMYEINAEQKRRAPVDMGLLRSSLNVVKVAPLNWQIVSAGPGSLVAPYLEFGTGVYIEIPNGLEEEARLFYVNGKGHTHAQPYFFSPFLTSKNDIIQRIIDILKK